VSAAQTAGQRLALIVVVDTSPIWNLVWEPRYIAAERPALCDDCRRGVVVVDSGDEVSAGYVNVGGVIDDVDLT